jgi:hypothetical protein
MECPKCFLRPAPSLGHRGPEEATCGRPRRVYQSRQQIVRDCRLGSSGGAGFLKKRRPALRPHIGAAFRFEAGTGPAITPTVFASGRLGEEPCACGTINWDLACSRSGSCSSSYPCSCSGCAAFPGPSIRGRPARNEARRNQPLDCTAGGAVRESFKKLTDTHFRVS